MGTKFVAVKSAFALGVVLALGACGTSTTERAATGGAGGAVAGALVGGPVGAVIGGAAGAGAGSTLNEDAGKKARDLVNNGTGSTGKSPASGTSRPMMSPDRVRSLQQALNDKGATIKVDGVWGHQTRQALSDFQKNQGLKVTGRLDKETSDKLGLPQGGNGANQSGSSGDNTNAPPPNAGSSQPPAAAPPPADTPPVVPQTAPGPADNTMSPPPPASQP